MEEGITTWAVYLPEGEWRDLWSGEVHLGSKVIEVNVPLDRIPVFQRKGSLLPLNLDQSGELGSPAGNATDKFDHLTLQIFPGERMEAAFLQSADTEPATITVETHEQEGRLIVQLPALSKNVDLVIFVNEPEFFDGKWKIIVPVGAACFPRPGQRLVLEFVKTGDQDPCTRIFPKNQDHYPK